MKAMAIDTESTGLDIAHGALPFLVTTCDDEGMTRFWEWDVNPITRKPDIPIQDVVDIQSLIEEFDVIYAHNSKYDSRLLAAMDVDLPWAKVRDTLVAGHLLATNHPHNLTDMCVEYLGRDLLPLEKAIKEVTRACRTIARREHPDWRIAEEGDADMPSVKGSSKRDEDKPWKNDMWLPRALGFYRATQGRSMDVPHWQNACAVYANGDSEHTLLLGLEVERQIRERGLWAIYEHRLNLPRVACEMECYGVTAIGEYTEATIRDYGQYVAEAEAAMVDIAAEYGHDLQLASGAALNDNMRDFFYGAVQQECPRCGYTKRVKHWNGERANGEVCPKCAKPKRGMQGMTHKLVTTQRDNLSLPIVGNKKTGNATLDKEAMQDYLTTLDDGPALDFVRLLADKRNYDTALTYMEAYRRFWVPVPGTPGYFHIHPSLNPCGTDHLRWASNSPNMQNVSGESKEISNKACFGPAPGREWWDFDYKSVEARIPAYESGELKMIEVFEHPNEPPYWGSLYTLTASVLYPSEYWPLAEKEGAFRKAYPRLYKQAKFFVLAKNYGAGRRKGDLLSKVHDSYDLVDNEFPLLAKLQAKYLRDAEKTGWVETLPDRTVDPDRGYPILASRTDDGRVLSTTPFNYHVSGTACWVKNTALVRCVAQCAEWRRKGFDAHVALEVHDSILFDFPRGATPEANLPRALVLKGLMERSGPDLVPSIPTPVSCELHLVSWAKGVAM